MQFPLSLRLGQRAMQTEMKRYLTVYLAHIRYHHPHRGQYEQMLYLHIGFEPTIRHEYTPCTDLLPTIAQHEALEIESTLRTPHGRNRVSVFPGESFRCKPARGETLFLCQCDPL